MLKVSFKKDCKNVKTYNEKVTEVTLVGELKMSIPTQEIPFPIYEWMTLHPSVDVVQSYDNYRIELTGKSKRAEGDKFNPVIGERIAESRAKIRLYKFLTTLCTKLRKHYSQMLTGKADCFFYTAVDKHCIATSMLKYQQLLDKEGKHLEKLLQEL